MINHSTPISGHSIEIGITNAPGVYLKIAERGDEHTTYATSTLPKSFHLVSNRSDLAEEAVGFGFPVLKRGRQSIFPGELLLTNHQRGTTRIITACFQLNRVEKISSHGTKTVQNKVLYAIKNSFADAIRLIPVVRGLLTFASSILRRIFNLETVYVEEAGFSSEVKVITTIEENSGRISVEVDASAIPTGITEVVVMNEQGAHFFDRYRDSSGISLDGKEIGCWDVVTSDEAWFESSTGSVAFRLRLVEGARLFHGRELVGSRLSWAGFGYTFPPSIQRLKYDLMIERLK